MILDIRAIIQVIAVIIVCSTIDRDSVIMARQTGWAFADCLDILDHYNDFERCKSNGNIKDIKDRNVLEALKTRMRVRRERARAPFNPIKR